MTQASYRGVPIYGPWNGCIPGCSGTSFHTTLLISATGNTADEALSAFRDHVDRCIAYIQHTGEFPTVELGGKIDSPAVEAGQKWSLNGLLSRFLIITHVSPDGAVSYQYDDGRVGYSTAICLPLNYTLVQSTGDQR